MTYQYTAKSATGDSVSGLLEALSPIDARQQLRQQGLFTLTLKNHQQGTAPTATANRWQVFGSRITKRDLLMLTTQLGIMTKSGIDLAEAFENMARQCRKPALKTTLDTIYGDISNGQSPSDALKKHSHIFGNAYVAVVEAGEASGRVPEVLARLTELLRNEIRLRATITAALSYPMLIGVVASVVLTALVFFVLPQFAQVFRDMGTPAPPMTRILLDSAQFLRENILMLGVLFVSGMFALFQLASTDAARRYRDGMLLNGILLREATRPLFMGRTFRLMGSMLQSGVPLLEVIQLCRSSVKNVHFHKLFDVLEVDVLNGRGIAVGLNACNFVPPGAAEMVTTAEKTGKLGAIMETVGEFYEEEGQRQVTTIAGFLEPIIIVGLGIVVAFVVLSIMLPLLDFSSLSS